MKLKLLFILLFSLIPVCTHSRNLLKVDSFSYITKYPLEIHTTSFREKPGPPSFSNSFIFEDGSVQYMNPFSGGDSKTGNKKWKWIGFGTFQAAAWAALFHCGAPKLSVPILLGVSYVFLF